MEESVQIFVGSANVGFFGHEYQSISLKGCVKMIW